jgi:SPP1 family predicted phage head-tail adaptor
MSLAAGRLRHFVGIERLLRSKDSNGDTVEEWETIAQVWAAIEPVSAREFVASQAAQSQVSARITIRYRSDVDATMRVTHRGRIYNIAGVLPDKESGLEYLTLPVSEGVNQG